MLIAGEASGDTLGAELVKALRAESPESLTFFGTGGPKMAEAGVDLAFDLTSHAVVGIIEVLKNYGKFKAFFHQLLALAAARKPDYIILIDYPGFNLRFAKALKERARSANSDWKPKIVYYVSPQIWAWHESRIHQIARDIDLLLAIFPFEKDWYAKRKPHFRVEFVGHPLVDRYKDYAPVSRKSDQPLVLLLPGSRQRELRKHLPVMVPAAERLAREQNAELLMVLPNERLVETAQSFLPFGNQIRIQTGDLAGALSQASATIASSGTVTMECAYFRVPTVVIYKTSWSTHFLGRRFIKVKHLAMPNLLAGEQIFPELIQDQANTENIYAAARSLLENPPRRNAIRAELRRVIESLGAPGASTRAARAILGC